MNWKRTFGCLLAVLLLGALAVAGAGWWAHRTLDRPYRGYPGEERIVAVEPGTPSVRILERLQAEGVIRNAILARAWLVYGLGNPPLQAGEYRFAGAASTGAVLDKLIRGDVLTHGVTVVEGLTLEETGGRPRRRRPRRARRLRRRHARPGADRRPRPRGRRPRGLPLPLDLLLPVRHAGERRSCAPWPTPSAASGPSTSRRGARRGRRRPCAASSPSPAWSRRRRSSTPSARRSPPSTPTACSAASPSTPTRRSSTP